MRLCLFIVPTGHHEASWRLTDSPLDRLYDVSYYVELAGAAERAGLDAIFLADAPALRTNVRYNTGGSLLEPFTLLSAIATRTRTIGLIGTASTTYAEPYNVARLLSSLDHISGGRAGWNMVTTSHAGAASSFGVAHPPRRERYERAHEFVWATKELWRSWGAEALVGDRVAGLWADAEHIERVQISGRHVRLDGPFQSARSPQVWPLLVQAGASPDGRNFAAAHAEVVFSVQRDRDRSAAFRRDLGSRAAIAGRKAEDILFLPGLSINVAATRAEAEEREAHLSSLINPSYGVHQIEVVSGVDLSGVQLDQVVRADMFADASIEGTFATRRDEIVEMVDERPQTLRELLERIAGARTHRVLTGTPHEVADSMQDWFESGACDGFNLMPPALPGDLHAFIKLVLPELERRGCWSRAQGPSLRSRLGLPDPDLSGGVRP